jgi:rubrerythrin
MIVQIMGETNTVKDLLLLAILAEEKARIFYSGLVKMFLHVPQVSAVWKEMMSDEVLHARKLKEIFKLVSEKEAVMPDASIYEKLGSKLNSIVLEDVFNSIDTLDDAYEIAYSLENSEINDSFKFIMNEYVPSGERHNFVLSMIWEHVSRLENLGSPEWRQGIKAIK